MKARAGLFVLTTVFAAAALAGGCASKNNSATNQVCSPGTTVFCRCDDKTSAGSKQCSADGKSYGACQGCPNDGQGDGSGDGSGNGSGNGDDGGFTPVDDGGTGDAGPPPPTPIDPSCAGKLTLLAGSDDTNNQFLYASTFDGTTFKSLSSSGIPMRSQATTAILGAKLVAVYRSKNDMVMTAQFDGKTWSTPEQVPSATTDQAPAIASWGATVKAIFHTTDGHYDASTYDDTFGWDYAPEQIGSASSPTFTTGSAPTVIGAGTPDVAGSSVMVGFTDANSGIYRQEWHGTNWLASPIKATSVLAANMQPSLIALTAGDYDLLSTYVGSDGAVHAATRTSHDKGSMWSNPGLVSSEAVPTEGPSVAALDGGRALLVYRDANKKPFYTVFDSSKTPSWTAPAELVAGKNPTVAWTPSVAKDTCGADAVVAYAEDNGAVNVMRFANDAWTGPYVVGGLSKLTYASVAALP